MTDKKSKQTHIRWEEAVVFGVVDVAFVPCRCSKPLSQSLTQLISLSLSLISPLLFLISLWSLSDLSLSLVSLHLPVHHQVLIIVTKLFLRLKNSIDQMPISMRQFLAHVRYLVAQRWPEEQYKAMGE